MTDKQLVAKIVKFVRNSHWADIRAAGINQQQALKIRRGEEPLFRTKTLVRLRNRFESGRDKTTAA
jgi:hypothetical protein